MNSNDETRVLGYFAHDHARGVFRYEDACLIAGSEQALRAYIAASDEDRSALSLSKARFGKVREGLEDGAAYAFDEEAYGRFRPLASAAGIDALDEFAPGADGRERFHFIKVKLETDA